MEFAYNKKAPALHSEQKRVLDHKSSHDIGLIHDVRDYFKERARLERKLCEDLSKKCQELSKKYDSGGQLNPDEPNVKLVSLVKGLFDLDDSVYQHRLKHEVEPIEKAVESLKPFRSGKQEEYKKQMAELARYMKELEDADASTHKLRKEYTLVAKEAMGSRSKVKDLHSKLSEGKTGVFQSKSALRTKVETNETKLKAVETRNRKAENQYMVAADMLDMHAEIYFNQYLKKLMGEMDHEFYERMSSTLQQYAENAIVHGRIIQEKMEPISTASTKVQRDYENNMFLKANEVLVYKEIPFRAVDNESPERLSNTDDDDLSSIADSYNRQLKLAYKQKQQWTRELSAISKTKSTFMGDTPEAQQAALNCEQQIEDLTDKCRYQDLKIAKFNRVLHKLQDAGATVEIPQPDADYSAFDYSQLSFRESENNSHGGATSVGAVGSGQGFDDDDNFEAGNEGYAANGAASGLAFAAAQGANRGAALDDDFRDDDDDFGHNDQNGGYGASSGAVVPPRPPGPSMPAPVPSSGSMPAPVPSSGGMPAPLPATGVAAASMSAMPTKLRALYDYEAREQDEIDLYAGEVIELVNDPSTPQAWLTGRKANGRTGLIPENYVLQYKLLATAKEDNEDDEDGALRFRAGDVIEVIGIDPEDDSFLKGHLYTAVEDRPGFFYPDLVGRHPDEQYPPDFDWFD
eukprot:Clim_evm25s211 gene=Clim_evmTU25s211